MRAQIRNKKTTEIKSLTLTKNLIGNKVTSLK